MLRGISITLLCNEKQTHHPRHTNRLRIMGTVVSTHTLTLNSVKVTAHLAQHDMNYGLKPLEYAPEVGPIQCKTCVASAYVCVCIHMHTQYLVCSFLFLCRLKVSVFGHNIICIWRCDIFTLCMQLVGSSSICRYGLMTVVRLKHVTNQSEHTGLHKLLFHRRKYTLWLF